MADIVTPNLKEASALLDGVKINTVSDMRSAAKLLHDMGPRLVNGTCLRSQFSLNRTIYKTLVFCIVAVYYSPSNVTQLLDMFLIKQKCCISTKFECIAL